MSRSSYPGMLDSDVELPRVDDNISEIGSDAINSIRDAIFAIEKTVGVSPQGNMADLATRINSVIDANGVIKTQALSQKGLVTLPINNNQIDPNANIQESKLDLDYSTASLNAANSSVRADITTLQTSFTAFVAQTVNHFGGSGNRHDGYQIDLTTSIRGASNVGTALHLVSNSLFDHEQSTGTVHAATGISVNNTFTNIEASNVQEALDDLDTLTTGSLTTANDSLHDSAVAKNQRGEEGAQGNLRSTTLAPTIFQTETSKATNILQVMRPNVARITSKGADLRAVKAGTSSSLRILAGGVGRTALDVDLTAVLPTEDLSEIIRAINTKAQGCEDHYPISAYNTDGQLTIAHTIPGEGKTITIQSSVSASAHTALGFGDVADTTISWSGTSHSGYAGGKRVNDFKSLVKVRHNHKTKPLNTIILGLGDLSQFGIPIGNEGRVICNITNHSTTPTDNGTHYILAFPNSQKFVLSADIQLGEFDIEIMADSVNFENSANGEIFDIFVEHIEDGYGKVVKENRATFGTISGINIKAISESFPTNSVEWEVESGTSVKLLSNGEEGDPVNIPLGFTGELRVFAPDNINSALIEVSGVPAAGTSIKKSVSVATFAGSADRIYIGSVHYSGNFGEETLKYVTDRRQLGASVRNTTSDQLNPMPVEAAVSDLRNNGIIRGFDVLSIGSTVKVRGGRAYVSGKVVDVETQEVAITDFGEANRLLLLGPGGKFFVKSEFDAGFSFDELTAGDAYGDNRNVALVAQLHTDGSTVDSFSDRRLFISNIDKRLVDTKAQLEQRIDSIQDTVGGTFWGVTVAESEVEGDGYLASIESSINHGFTELDARGFSAENNLTTTRRFEFDELTTSQTSVFKAVGITHINVFADAVYTGSDGGPFGVSGTVLVDLGVAVEVGQSNITVTEDYATVKTIPTSIFASSSITERYVASIPTSRLGLSNNILFDVVPRIRIQGSTYVDGGPGGSDPNPEIRFDNVRIVTSSYSVAGNILSVDGSTSSIATTIDDVL